jgi:hypothetical protein
VGAVNTVTTIPDYHNISAAGLDISADGKCLAYYTKTSDSSAFEYHWELRIENVSTGDACAHVGTIVPPKGSADGIRPDGFTKGKFSPDGQSIYSVIIEYQSPSDTGGDWGVTKLDLATAVYTEVVAPSLTQRVMKIDVAESDGQTVVALEQKVSGSSCEEINMVDGDGAAIAAGGFPGLQPMFSSKGSLAQSGMPSLFYLPQDENCSLLNLAEIDPFSQSSVSTSVDPSDVIINDVN